MTFLQFSLNNAEISLILFCFGVFDSALHME